MQLQHVIAQLLQGITNVLIWLVQHFIELVQHLGSTTPTPLWALILVFILGRQEGFWELKYAWKDDSAERYTFGRNIIQFITRFAVLIAIVVLIVSFFNVPPDIEVQALSTVAGLAIWLNTIEWVIVIPLGLIAIVIFGNLVEKTYRHFRHKATP